MYADSTMVTEAAIATTTQKCGNRAMSKLTQHNRTPHTRTIQHHLSKYTYIILGEEIETCDESEDESVDESEDDLSNK